MIFIWIRILGTLSRLYGFGSYSPLNTRNIYINPNTDEKSSSSPTRSTCDQRGKISVNDFLKPICRYVLKKIRDPQSETNYKRSGPGKRPKVPSLILQFQNTTSSATQRGRSYLGKNQMIYRIFLTDTLPPPPRSKCPSENHIPIPSKIIFFLFQYLLLTDFYFLIAPSVNILPFFTSISS
jgi:hypothetical protein